MYRLFVLPLVGLFAVISSCKTAAVSEHIPQPLPSTGIRVIPFDRGYSELMCTVSVSDETTTKTENTYCSVKGFLVDSDNQPLVNIPVQIDSNEIEIKTDTAGMYFFDKVTPGFHVFKFKHEASQHCMLSIVLVAGDQVEMNTILSTYPPVQHSKPIIYLYPEETTEIEVRLNYDGELTTTYPKYPSDGWKVTAEPDGTLTDENGKEFYALYWEGKPKSPLNMEDGFVVSNENTVTFLEEKLALLGLNAREANEFIIFWLPIMEKNDFNFIHFAGDDYVKQAKLNITPTPKTTIRVMMIFQGLEEEIVVPIQDLTSLMTVRKGYTVVEWGGQELPKTHKLGI